MNNEGNLYIDILLWAYDKKHDGFTETELIERFSLNDGKRRSWYLAVFRRGTNDNPSIIEPNGDLWYLTEKGLSMAVDYIELSEARKSSRTALVFATWSLKAPPRLHLGKLS